MIQRLIAFFGEDGLAHMLALLLVCSLCGAFLPLWAAVLAAVAAAAWKELVWDMMLGRGHASWRDAACDASGVVLGIAVWAAYNCV